jgi:lysophospholipase L1-like esterase
MKHEMVTDTRQTTDCRAGGAAAPPSFDDFARRAEAGDRLCVAFMGGSLTWGARASDPQKSSYRALVGQKLQARYPQAHFTFVDAAIGGSGAQLGAFRFDRDVLARRPDLLFLDFTLNDGTDATTPDTLAAQEAIIRRAIVEARCPVVQMFLAAREHVTVGTTEKMKRRAAHLAIAEAYGVPCGDAIGLMQEKYRRGELDLDAVWPPESFDTCHPGDKGYALYAEAAWNAFTRAVAEKVVCHAPAKTLHGETYLRVARVRLSSLAPLPPGWRVSAPSTDYCAFDFLMTRWLDDVTIASNFVPLNHSATTPGEPAQPLRLAFQGASVLCFGQATPRSGSCMIVIDGREKTFDTRQLGPNNTGRMWFLAADDLDPAVEHSLDIVPLFEGQDKPAEICIESVCIAGGAAKAWKR